LDLGSWRGLAFERRLGFRRLGFGSDWGLNLHLSWRLGLGNLEVSLRLRLSFDWLRLGPGWGLRLRLRHRLGQRFRQRGLRLNLEPGLRLERLRQGRGLNRLNLAELLGGLSRQSLRRVELGLGWERGSRRELGSCVRNLAVRGPLGFGLRLRLPLDLLGGFDQRHG
jgi:hypothetical protein